MRPAGYAEPNPVAATVRASVRTTALSVAQEWSRQPWDAALLLCFAVFATLYALTTRNLPHQMWAVYAAGSYAIGAAILLARSVRRLLPICTHRRWLVFALLVLGTTVIPLAHQAVDGIANPEILILGEAADRWLSIGTPFPTEAELAGRGADVNAYNVYLPLLAVFGLPSALFAPAPGTDPRIYLLLASYAIFLGLGRRAGWPVALFMISPWVALQLVSGATDIPVLGCVLFGLVLVGRDRIGWAGLAMGVATGLKALAWPAVAIALILVRVRGGWPAVMRFTGVVVLVLTVVLGLPVLVDPAAFVVNAIKLPLGVLPVKLTAASPLPGHLLSQTGPIGQLVALTLLAVAALAIGGWALRRPPQDAVAAARWVALGMLVAMVLAPASRYGYLVYSVGLVLLPVLASDLPSGARADSLHPPGSSADHMRTSA
ncbi:MAG: glycosyltransferase 87 family protein [Pseudonocardiaceae bacterium]